jgi:hypothetical protein
MLSYCYIVYGYYSGSQSPTKYIMGIYTSLNDAINRINNYDTINHTNDFSNYSTHYKNGMVLFLNKIPFGDSQSQIFNSTPPNNLFILN